VGVAQPLDDWAKAALMHMPVMGQDALQLLDDGCEYWFDRLGAQPTTKSYSHTSPPGTPAYLTAVFSDGEHTKAHAACCLLQLAASLHVVLQR